MNKWLISAVFAVCSTFAVTGYSHGGTVLDLRTVPSGTVTGPLGGTAIFRRDHLQPAGTGVIDPFVRIQRKGTERGYNSSGRPFTYDEKEPANYTRNLTLSEVPVVWSGGVPYREFSLDINEQASQPLVSLNDIRIAYSSIGSLTGTWQGGLHDTSPLWSMNGGNVDTLNAQNYASATLNRVELDYNISSSGSGRTDLAVYIPNSVFSGLSNTTFIYLYSRFGSPNKSDSGFEEWFVRRPGTFDNGEPPPPPPVVPLPTAYAMGLALFGSVGGVGWMRGRPRVRV